jgi:hypothetical protein
VGAAKKMEVWIWWYGVYFGFVRNNNCLARIDSLADIGPVCLSLWKDVVATTTGGSLCVQFGGDIWHSHNLRSVSYVGSIK